MITLMPMLALMRVASWLAAFDLRCQAVASWPQASRPRPDALRPRFQVVGLKPEA